ncbi:MAG: LL-diaminopimelate aminotransferase [Candidatus Altiarchaeota archaeon]
MVRRNGNMGRLPAGYLFPEIGKRRMKLALENPKARIISLGVGNTTQPITPHVADALKKAAEGLGTRKGYSGYGDEQGFPELRERIAKRVYQDNVEPGEVFISDGAKCDIGRLQLMFGRDVTVAVQDPSYPVYVDGSVIVGASGDYNVERRQFNRIAYLSCNPENGFFPDLKNAPKTDLIYFCSPNNPTGKVAEMQEMEELVSFAKRNGSIVVYDSAYSEYITDRGLPKSIFEIEGAKEVAIEISSFSKLIGFTGVRLGWTVVPEALKYDDGTPVINDWNRIMSTVFNGASNIAQHGGLAALDSVGLKEMRQTIRYYLVNARIIREALESMGIRSWGGTNSPYIWAQFPGKKSWEVFDRILDEAHVVTTPGSGFGPAGEGFVRFSAFGHRKDVEEAVGRLRKLKF